MTTEARPNMRPLSEEQIEALRERFPYQASNEWVSRLAAQDGWQEANRLFLDSERRRAHQAMRYLMKATGIDRVRSRDEALDLIELAFQVFAGGDGFTGTIERQPDGVLHIEVQTCPVYEALEASHWFSVTACPSWHRRRGWLDALGVQATDTLLGEKKWGDAACATEIQIQHVA